MKIFGHYSIDPNKFAKGRRNIRHTDMECAYVKLNEKMNYWSFCVAFVESALFHLSFESIFE